MKGHKISLMTAILMNINIMVGSGILIGPGIMAGIAGNASFLGWPLVALFFLPMVLCTVQMSRMCPGAGGFYAYAKEGLSKTAGFWSGCLYVIGYTFSVAVELLALKQPLLAVFGSHWLVAHPFLYNIVLVGSCMALNILGMRIFSRILNSLTIFKVIPLFVLILLIPFIINPTFTITGQELSLVPFSLSITIFGYLGFEYCCSISHLVEDSEKNAPLAILIGFFATALIYTLFHFGLLNLMGAKDLNAFTASRYAEFITLPIPYLKTLLNFIIPLASAITLFAAANGLMNANAVMLHTMGTEQLLHFSNLFTKMTSWYRPWFNIVVQGTLVLLLITFLPSIKMISGLSIFGILLSFILPFVSLLLIQRRTGKTSKIPLTVLALIVTIGLAAYALYDLAPDTITRLISLLPMLVLLGLAGCLARRDTLRA